MGPMDYCFNNPADGGSADGDYYMIFGKLRNDEAIEMYIAHTTKGDDEFDQIVEQLGLKSFSFTEDDFDTAEEWARNDARRIHPTLPVEIRFMDDGEISMPFGMMRLPVDAEKPRNCHICRSDDTGRHCWFSFWKWGHPVFCSMQCAKEWYVEIPLAKLQSTGACHRGGAA